MKALFLFLLFSVNMIFVYSQPAQAVRKNFRILVLAENGGHHIKFTQAAKPWLNQLAKENQFTVDYVENTDLIDSAYLSNYQLFLQLDSPPYGWPEKAVKYLKIISPMERADGSDCIMQPCWVNLMVIPCGHGFPILWAE